MEIIENKEKEKIHELKDFNYENRKQSDMYKNTNTKL